MKEKIREFALAQGADYVGFAAAADYDSPLSQPLEAIFPGVKSLTVLAYRELATCESDSPQIAMNGRLDLMEFSRSTNYKVARFIQAQCGGKGMTVPISYPMKMDAQTKGTVGEVSMRHAALAAGLGTFGRNNLILHPELGSRVLFTAVLSDLELDSDPRVTESACDDCRLCVEACPVNALDEEGKTEVFQCLKNSQPYGIGGAIKFGMKYDKASPEGKKEMLFDPHFWTLYQAGFIGFQYFCWNCMKECPAGQG
jgi:epoxyqueuosine reductase QueG